MILKKPWHSDTSSFSLRHLKQMVWFLYSAIQSVLVVDQLPPELEPPLMCQTGLKDSLDILL